MASTTATATPTGTPTRSTEAMMAGEASSGGVPCLHAALPGSEQLDHRAEGRSPQTLRRHAVAERRAGEELGVLGADDAARAVVQAGRRDAADADPGEARHAGQALGDAVEGDHPARRPGVHDAVEDELPAAVAAQRPGRVERQRALRRRV